MLAVQVFLGDGVQIHSEKVIFLALVNVTSMRPLNGRLLGF